MYNSNLRKCLNHAKKDNKVKCLNNRVLTECNPIPLIMLIIHSNNSLKMELDNILSNLCNHLLLVIMVKIKALNNRWVSNNTKPQVSNNNKPIRPRLEEPSRTQ